MKGPPHPIRQRADALALGLALAFLSSCGSGAASGESDGLTSEGFTSDPAPTDAAAAPTEIGSNRPGTAANPAQSAGRTAVDSNGEIPLSGTESDEDWAILLDRIRWARERGLEDVPIGEAVAALGETFVGEPYTPYTLEVAGADGPEALVVNLREFDCVTFVESSLALARTLHGNRGVDDPDRLRRAYVAELAGLRYRSGIIAGYPSRLHYFSEWIGDNAKRGTLQPLSHLLGGSEDREPVDFMSTHADAYPQLTRPENLAAIREVEARLADVPRYPVRQNRIAQFEDEIETGDVIAATSTVAGLDVAHTGIAIRVDGRLHLMHAPLVGKSVEISAKPLAERIIGIGGQDGIYVARPLPISLVR